ncbi:MAG: FAD-dependent oxidoreductase [Desulfobacterales bacterium]|nr:FAD-dependent oxidoreductase [Desulfobacterales bacterium]
MSHENLDVAVIGGGVSGITAAYLLQQRHRVSLYERNDYVGGHTHTVIIPDGPDAGTPVDTGFIVLNDRTYPLFNRLLQRLGVDIRPSDMSFSYHSLRSGYQYASRGLSALFAQRANLVNPAHLYMLTEILRFNRAARAGLKDGSLGDMTLGGFLRRMHMSRFFRTRYIIPMAAAIWSSPDDDIMDFPMATFARFFHNHGLLSVRDQPQWYYVRGGSHRYVKAFRDDFKGEIHTQRAISSLKRSDTGVDVRFMDGSRRRHDMAVVATHADEALALLEDPSAEEKHLLGAWRYSRNRVVLHTDVGWMPPQQRAWASWNYRRASIADDHTPIVLTYHMNRLQRLRTQQQYFVTLNPPEPIDPQATVDTFIYHHPMYTFSSMATQAELPRLNASRRTYYCGSYWGYGFHEDAVRAAVSVAAALGADL